MQLKYFFHNSSPEIFQFMWSCKNWKHCSKYINNFWKLLQVWMLWGEQCGLQTAKHYEALKLQGYFWNAFYKFKKYNKDSVKFKITVPILRCKKQSIGIIICLDLDGKPSILSASNICVFFTIPLESKPKNMLNSTLVLFYLRLLWKMNFVYLYKYHSSLGCGLNASSLKLVETWQCHHSKENSILL